MRVTRRTFLQATAAGAAVLAMSGVGLGLRATVHRESRRELTALSPRAFSILAAVADRLLDYGEGAPSAVELEVAEGVDVALAALHPGITAEIEQALFLLENAAAGLLLDGRINTFTASSPAAQLEILEGWRHSRFHLLRQAYNGLHTLCNGVYWSDPRVFALVGYPGPPDLTAIREQLPVIP